MPHPVQVVTMVRPLGSAQRIAPDAIRSRRGPVQELSYSSGTVVVAVKTKLREFRLHVSVPETSIEPSGNGAPGSRLLPAAGVNTA
jgi:hypothetical protein